MSVPRIPMPLTTGDLPVVCMHLPSRENPAQAVSLATGMVSEIPSQTGADNGGVLVICLPALKDGGGNKVRFRALAVAGGTDATEEEVMLSGLPLDAGLYPVYLPRGCRLFMVVDSYDPEIVPADCVFFWMEEV